MSKNLMMTAAFVTVIAGAAFFGSSFIKNATPVNALATSVHTASQSSPTSHNKGPIKWHSYDEGIALAKAQKKPVYVQFFANWCGYCRKMDKEVFSSKKVQAQLHNEFVAIRVTESSDNKVSFEGREITEKELTVAHQVTGFPTHLFLATDGKVIGKQPGYIALDNMQSILGFIQSESYKSMDYKKYLATKKG